MLSFGLLAKPASSGSRVLMSRFGGVDHDGRRTRGGSGVMSRPRRCGRCEATRSPAHTFAVAAGPNGHTTEPATLGVLAFGRR
jgi:hypothetical protein